MDASVPLRASSYLKIIILMFSYSLCLFINTYLRKKQGKKAINRVKERNYKGKSKKKDKQTQERNKRLSEELIAYVP
jgi:hypothetical protein